MVDTYLRARESLVQFIAAHGVKNGQVLAALRKVPRHRFAESSLAHRCYENLALPIGEGQTISQPLTVALMTDQLRVSKEHRVLEVGTGSGYQTAVLAELAKQVFTIEQSPVLHSRARAVLTNLHYTNIKFRVGDGSLGWSGGERFDRIIVTAAGSEVPHKLLEQLIDPGRLIMPIGNGGKQELILIIKHQGKVRRRRLSGCEFLPLVGGSDH